MHVTGDIYIYIDSPMGLSSTSPCLRTSHFSMDKYMFQSSFSEKYLSWISFVLDKCCITPRTLDKWFSKDKWVLWTNFATGQMVSLFKLWKKVFTLDKGNLVGIRVIYFTEWDCLVHKSWKRKISTHIYENELRNSCYSIA